MAIPIELQDVTRVLSQLVMPSPRRQQQPTSAPYGNHNNMKHLAPIEMAAHSIHMHQPYHTVVGPSSAAACAPAAGQLQMFNSGHFSNISSNNNNKSSPPPSSVSIPVSSGCSDHLLVFSSQASLLQQQSVSSASFPSALYSHACNTTTSSGRNPVNISSYIQGWLIPVGYMTCGLGMGLCNLITPGNIPACANLLCPIWTLSLALHAATETDPLWIWSALLSILLLPFVILVRDFLFVAFYLLVFTGFTSGRFWQTFQGPMFILLCICCGGLVVCCILSLTSDHPAYQITVAGFFSITASIITSSSKLGKLSFRIG